MRLLAAAVLICAASAQPALEAPQEGLMLDHNGALRPLTGIAQSFTVGDPVQTDVASAACGRSLCVAIPASRGSALISIEGDSALVYFRETHQFARYRDGKFEPLDWSVEGELLALGRDRLVVRRDTGVWIISLNGPVLGSLPEDVKAALMLEATLVYATTDGLIITRADGSQARFDVANVKIISQLSEHYIQVSTDDASYALRIDPGREQICVLPEVQQ
jgi:hypothetical protein